MVQAIAVSHPAPSAKPLMASNDGLAEIFDEFQHGLSKSAGFLGLESAGLRQFANIRARDEGPCRRLPSE